MTIPTIAVFTHTGLLTAAEIQACVAAGQDPLHRDFAPHYGDTVLRYVAPGELIQPDWWQCAFFDHTDQADALGYHDVTASGQPLMKIFAKDAIDDGVNWNVTFWHEVHEARADSSINKTVDAGGYQFAWETDDACEADKWGVRVNGHLISNSVTPAWFDPNGKPPYTIYPCAQITAPFMLASGGYIGRRQLPNGAWSQLLAADADPRQIKRPSSRTTRRFAAADSGLSGAAGGA